MSETDLCPISGLPVTWRQGWSDPTPGADYGVQVQVLARSVVCVRSFGYATGNGIERSAQLVDRAVSEGIGRGRLFVHLSDLTSLRGASRGARQAYARTTLRREGIVATVFCGASPLLTLAVKLARLTLLRGRRVELVRDYPAAVQRAVALLAEHGVALEPSPAADLELAAPGSGVSSRPEWQLALPGLDVRYEIVDGSILHGIGVGRLNPEHLPAVFAMNRRVATRIACPPEQAAVVVNAERLDRLTLSARRGFVEWVRRWHGEWPFRLFLIYGASRSLRAAVNLSRPLVPFRVRFAPGANEAFELARSGPDQGGWLRRVLDGPGAGRRPASVRRDVDELLTLLAGVDWEKEGVGETLAGIDPGHPMAPVADAVALIKSDIDQILDAHRRAEAALRDSEERYRTVLDAIVDGYYEVDHAGAMLHCNGALLELLGYGRDELIGLNNREYMDSDNAARVFETFNRVWSTGEPAKAFGWKLRRKDGRAVPVEASISLVRSATGDPIGFRGIVRDVSERLRAEEERERLEIQLWHAQRMESLGRLAGGIAHNFNNLLMGIQANADLVAAELGPTGEAAERLRTIATLVEGGSRLTAQLLGYARSGLHEVRAIDLNRLASRTLDTFSVARREIRIRQQLDPAVPAVRADWTQLEQVLLNLLVNAADAMPRGGELVVSTGEVTEASLTGRGYVVEPGRYVQLTVTDSGVGMDAATLERIFEPFFTTKGGSGGTGLGLSSAYGIVKAHRGYIDAFSEPGQGTTFLILLPATEEAPEEPPGVPPVTRRVQTGRGAVLVVDDDPAVLRATEAMLRRLGYTPVSASSGAEAVATIQAGRPRCAAVILDLILPDMRGGDVFDALKAIEPDLRVLLSSGYSEDGEAAEILDRGCDAFLQKPYSMEQLAAVLSALMSGT